MKKEEEERHRKKERKKGGRGWAVGLAGKKSSRHKGRRELERKRSGEKRKKEDKEE